LREFGLLIAFRLVDIGFGFRAAISASPVAIVAESLWRRRRGECFTRLCLPTSGLALVFGAVDLCVTAPSLLKCESAATNIATAISFVIGAFGERPMIQEMAEQRSPDAFLATTDVRRFVQSFTLAWALYFFARAAYCACVGWRRPLVEALALRSLFDGASLGPMIAVSVTHGRRLFFLCRVLGLSPRAGARVGFLQA
jgi:intracellular septation protein A